MPENNSAPLWSQITAPPYYVGGPEGGIGMVHFPTVNGGINIPAAKQTGDLLIRVMTIHVNTKAS